MEQSVVEGKVVSTQPRVRPSMRWSHRLEEMTTFITQDQMAQNQETWKQLIDGQFHGRPTTKSSQGL